MKHSQRGPSPRLATSWKEMSFNETSGMWEHKNRDELPREYMEWKRSFDWYSDHSRIREAFLAKKYLIPWKFRGPDGPEHGGPDVWNSCPWNPNRGSYHQRAGDPARQAVHRRNWLQSQGTLPIGASVDRGKKGKGKGKKDKDQNVAVHNDIDPEILHAALMGFDSLADATTDFVCGVGALAGANGVT